MRAFKNERDGLTCTTFANGFSVSVAFHSGAYCDGGKTTAEVAVFGPDGEFHRMPGENDDVISHQTADQVLAISIRVANL